MPACVDPVASYDNRQWIIQAEGTDCSAAAGGKAAEFHPFCSPRKMVRPALPSRMKERDLLPRVGVDAMRFRPLMLIAQLTGEAEIVVVV